MTAHYETRHRVRARFVIGVGELDLLERSLRNGEVPFDGPGEPNEVHDVYFGQTAVGGGGALPVLDESERDGLATRLRFRWRGDDTSSALGHLQLESETTGLACQVSQRVDALLDPTSLTVADLRGILLEHTQGFLRLELARRAVSTLYAGSTRRVLASTCGRIWATVDGALRCAILGSGDTVVGPSVPVDPDHVVVTLHARQRDIAPLLRTAEALPFERSGARQASRARFHLLG